MSLNMLMSGADCGPVNPLQGLAKRFEQDRGIQQDFFGPGRAGSSREVFRSEQSSRPDLHQDAARFFSPNQHSSVPAVQPPFAFDLAAMQASLPSTSTSQPRMNLTTTVASPAPNAVASWASDFMVMSPKQQSGMASSSQIQTPMQVASLQVQNHPGNQMQGIGMGGMQMTPPNFNMQGFRSPMPQFGQEFGQVMQQPQPMQPDHSEKLWDQEFHAHSPQPVMQPTTIEPAAKTRSRPANETDELARTAGGLIDAVSHEQNPKFKNSAFMGLMRQLRDRELVVDNAGSSFVENDGTQQSQRDVKGKGKAVTFDMPMSNPDARRFWTDVQPQFNANSTANTVPGREEDPNEAYFRQDNEEYINYWQHPQAGSSSSSSQGQDVAHPGIRSGDGRGQEMAWEETWGSLQEDWDKFEATESGIRTVGQEGSGYRFQEGNPYVVGAGRAGMGEMNRMHMLHRGMESSFFESVLQLEATVQQDPSNALAWFALGVKQQENEREGHAIAALRRALSLNPSHLPSWLALAVSHTNEGNRQETYEAVKEWVERNKRYEEAVARWRMENSDVRGDNDGFREMIGCLIACARSVGEGEVDADVQVALAVLLNTNEEYAKASDCFQAALSVRPDDWLLYNRVGATMANNGRPGDAVSYYYRALELNPAYIRARFNLGISCLNLKRFDEAVQHIFDALVLQDSDRVASDSHSPGAASGVDDGGRGIMSNALWNSLKTTVLQMGRMDLAGACDVRDLEEFRRRLDGVA